MLRFNCQQCQKSIKAPFDYAGKMVQCPGCGFAFKVVMAPPADVIQLDCWEVEPPAAKKPCRAMDQEVSYECSGCGVELLTKPGRNGDKVVCPVCKYRVRLMIPPDMSAGRRNTDQDNDGCLVFGLIVTTMIIPLVGIVVGATDLGSNNKRRQRQGMVFLVVGLIWALIYASLMT